MTPSDIAALLGCDTALLVDAQNRPLVRAMVTPAVHANDREEALGKTTVDEVLSACSVVTIKVIARGGNSDDAVYRENPELLALVPRGFSIVVHTATGAPLLDDMGRRVQVRGLPKFGGIAPEEEDDCDGSGVTCIDLAPLDLAARCDNGGQVFIAEKANGKLALMSAWRINGALYIFGGSKNSHEIVLWERAMATAPPSDADADADADADGCGGGGDILITPSLCKAFLRWAIIKAFCEEIEISDYADIVETMAQDGVTLCAEYCDGKHMVPIIKVKGSRSSYLAFFAIVDSGSGEVVEPLAALLRLSYAFGLHTVSYRSMSPADVLAQRDTLRHTNFSLPTSVGRRRLRDLLEGHVLYHVGVDEKLVAIEKLKGGVYFMLRAIRQVAMAAHPQTDARLWRSLKSKTFLGLPAGVTYAWWRAGAAFVDWMEANGVDPKSLSCQSVGMGETFARFIAARPETHVPFEAPALEDQFQSYLRASSDPERFRTSEGFQQFLAEDRTIVRDALTEAEVDAMVASELLARPPRTFSSSSSSSSTAAATGTIVVALVGPPGLGKSTVAAALLASTSTSTSSTGPTADPTGSSMVVVSQDGHAGDKAAFMGELSAHLVGAARTIIVDRCDSTVNETKAIVAAADKAGARTLFVVPSEMASAELAHVCLRAAIARTEHATLRGMDPRAVFNITSRFINNCRSTYGSGGGPNVAVVGWLSPDASDCYGEAARSTASPEDVLETLTAAQVAKMRRPACEIAIDICATIEAYRASHAKANTEANAKAKANKGERGWVQLSSTTAADAAAVAELAVEVFRGTPDDPTQLTFTTTKDGAEVVRKVPLRAPKKPHVTLAHESEGADAMERALTYMATATTGATGAGAHSVSITHVARGEVRVVFPPRKGAPAGTEDTVVWLTVYVALVECEVLSALGRATSGHITLHRHRNSEAVHGKAVAIAARRMLQLGNDGDDDAVKIRAVRTVCDMNITMTVEHIQ